MLRFASGLGTRLQQHSRLLRNTRLAVIALRSCDEHTFTKRPRSTLASHQNNIHCRWSLQKLVMAVHNLQDVTLGFFGGGMMAEAILRGLLAKSVLAPRQITVCELVPHRRDQLSKLGVSVTADGKEMVEKSRVVILAVKPDVVPIVLRTVTDHEQKEKNVDRLLISICAGVTLDALSTGNPGRNCIRVMPNQPCLVGEAASAYAMSDGCTDAHKDIVDVLMGACGVALELPEKNLDAVTGLSGSGPAYVYMMIEAMTDGGVRSGLPRIVARKLAAQTVFGAAKMALAEPDVHPAELRNRVESPGGTTTAATAALEECGFRTSVITAVARATERSKELGKQ